MSSILYDDLYRYIGINAKKFRYKLRYIIFTPGFQYIYLLRKAQYASNYISRIIYTSLLKLCSYKFAIQIPYQTQIGKGFRIVHWGHIVINPNTVIGKNFNISQGCLIGNSQGKKPGSPMIGDNVCMNANSIIIGGGV